MHSPTPPTFGVPDANRIFKFAFELGRKVGYEDAQAQVDIAEMTADYWYFIANNPGAIAEEKRQHLSFVELWEVRAEQQRRRQQWDEDEQHRFDQARAMLNEGMDPVDVAAHLELFIPIVRNIQAGVL